MTNLSSVEKKNWKTVFELEILFRCLDEIVVIKYLLAGRTLVLLLENDYIFWLTILLWNSVEMKKKKKIRKNN